VRPANRPVPVNRFLGQSGRHPIPLLIPLNPSSEPGSPGSGLVDHRRLCRFTPRPPRIPGKSPQSDTGDHLPTSSDLASTHHTELHPANHSSAPSTETVYFSRDLGRPSGVVRRRSATSFGSQSHAAVRPRPSCRRAPSPVAVSNAEVAHRENPHLPSGASPTEPPLRRARLSIARHVVRRLLRLLALHGDHHPGKLPHPPRGLVRRVASSPPIICASC